MFNVVIQLGAILAVVILYFNKLNPFASNKSQIEKKDTWSLWFKVVIACIPAGVLGIMYDDFLELHFHKFVPVAIMLILYGILFIVVENHKKGVTPKITTLNGLTYKTAFIIGLFQVLSLVPGTSRSGATIIGAIIIGCSRFVAAEFTFFLGIPVMFGASGVKILKFIAKGNSFGTPEIIMLLLGAVVAFIVSILAIKFLMGYIKKHDFKVFGWYRIILGTIILIYWITTL